jgi:AcrR family transcriptional regulator
MIIRRGTGASMEDLAAEAGITKPVLYRYFGDRAGLYLALAHHWQHQAVSAAAAELSSTTDPRAQIRALIDTYMRQVVEEQSLFVTLLVEPTIFQNVSVSLVNELMVRLSPDLGPAFEAAGHPIPTALPILIGAIGCVHNLMLWWISESPCSQQELVDLMVAQVWSGVGPWFADPSIPSLAPAAVDS